MKNSTKVSLWIFTILFGLVSQAGADNAKLRQMADKFKKEHTIQKKEAVDFARLRGLPIRKEFKNGRIIEIQKIENGIPRYYTTHNSDAAVTTRTQHLWAAPFSTTGVGYNKLAEWDGGAILAIHEEFGGAVTQIDSPSAISDHATHVAGTLIAVGVESNAKGMAPDAPLWAYDWNNDDSEMAAAAEWGMEISNHSYGYSIGWDYNGSSWNWYGDTAVDQNESYWFGFYDSSAKDWDEIAYNAPNYLIVKSAGNDRNDDAPPPDTNHTHNGVGWFTDTHYDDGYDRGGFDTISPKGVAKNVLTVGAVEDLPVYNTSADVNMSSFSGWGPADDGRIKPDIAGNGVSLYSSIGDSNTSYGRKSGTSMASPNVAGTLALLQQYYQKEHNNTIMRSATLKALVLHTADEAGDHPGPDYKFGWGLLNAKKAAEKILEDTNQSVINEHSLADGESYTCDIELAGSNPAPLKVTIVWTDPEGTPPALALDPPDKMLVNDLNLKITKDGTTYYPWKLDKNNPNTAATQNGANDVDNVEQVYIDSPDEGTYTVTVDHEGTLTADQNFSIILSTGCICCYTENDFNNDKRSDILWKKDNGAYTIWTMNENGKTGSIFIGKKAGWSVEGTGYFNGDCTADILWQKENGKFAVKLMDETGETGSIFVGGESGWSVEGVDDFNDDNRSDILWKKDNGAYTIWTMDETGKTGSVWIGEKEGWSVEGTGDFDGDGKADILWRKANCAYTIWTMDETGKTGSIWIGTKEGWSVEGVGDFNNDTKSDILWRKENGKCAVRLMSGTGETGSIFAGGNTEWSVESVGDFNGDGNADILWKNDSDAHKISLMDENGKTGSVWIGIKSGWRVQPSPPPDPLPENITIDNAALQSIIPSIFSKKPAVDLQGVIDAEGLNVTVPYTVVTAPVTLPAYSTSVILEASVTQDGEKCITATFGWAEQSDLAAGSGIFTATITIDDSSASIPDDTYNAKKLDLDIDMVGLIAAAFPYAIDDAGRTGTLTLKIFPGIPDRMFGVADNDGDTETHKFLYLPVTNTATGKTWLNNNLGANYANINSRAFDLAQQATATDDYNAYGSLFQWGRKADGHELINWTSGRTGTGVHGVTTTKSDEPAHALFIRAIPAPYDWRAHPDDTLWANEASINNVCPIGYRAPTAEELEEEMNSWATDDIYGALDSQLSLPAPGYRYWEGSILMAGVEDHCWGSTVSGEYAHRLSFYWEPGGGSISPFHRHYGYTVRCIKD